MFKTKGKLFSLLTACLTAVLALVLGFAALFAPTPITTANAAETTITFTLGTDGSASHSDGSTAKTTYTETVGGYTLNLTNGSNMYTGARDAIGNGCIKLGASSKAGGFSFTVPNDVTSVVIAVAKYKANTTKLTVNGTSYTLTKNSNDGAYDEITIDTTSTKTITLTTVSGGVRAMVNSIEFIITDSGTEPEPGCTHANTTTTTVDATCTEDGSITVTCVDCGETVSTEVIEATGHLNTTEETTTPPTCTEAGEKTVTCNDCGNVETKEIPATGHNFAEGFCTVCGDEEPAEATLTLTFDDTEKRTEYSTSKQVWVENGITVTNNKASSTNNVADYVNPVRFYAKSNLVIEYPDMTRIVFTCNSTGHATALNDSISDNTVTVTVDDKIVTVTFDEAVESFTISSFTAQVRMDSITVYFIKEEGVCQHENTTTTTVPATCTQDGSITVTCDDCGETVGDVTIIPAKHTNPIETVTQEPTCTEVGKMTIVCNDCGETISESTDIPATGHTFAGGVCTDCGAEQPAVATLTFDNTAKRTVYSNEQQVWVENYITVTNNKASSTTNVADYANPVRFYKNSELVIEYPGMRKIIFVCDSTDYAEALKPSITEGGTVTADGNTVTVTLAEATNSFTISTLGGQVRMNSITVVTVKIDGASLSLGESLAMNYYVTAAANLDEAVMYFDFNEIIYDVQGEKQGDGRYKFTLNEIAPQYMTTNISATLKLGETELASMAEYSVQAYAQNRLNKSSSDAEKELLTAMLYYGDAAQVHQGQAATTTTGVSGLTEVGDVTVAEENNKMTLTNADGIDTCTAWFVSANVWFSSVNKIRVTLSTAENVTLKINDVEVPVNGTTVYTDGIAATQFGEKVTFELYHNGVLQQTLKYSIYSYAYSMQDKATMGELVKALYRYGEAAKVYNGQ